MPPFENPDVEKMFQLWYGGTARKLGLSPNPDDPQHLYDYRQAFLAGAGPGGPDSHFPSDFKQFGHPTLMADQGQAFMFPQTQQNQGANFFGLPNQDPLGFLMKLLQGQFK